MRPEVNRSRSLDTLDTERSRSVADVLNKLDKAVFELKLNHHQLKTLSAIRHCRTAMLGGHVDGCDSCGHIKISYNSCRNRHCPKCQGHKREEWMAKRTAELLPVSYFHVVFTLPAELNPLALYKAKELYSSLQAAAWDTVAAFGKQVDLQMGMVNILHTWGQNLSLHPHAHCIVPGGGIDKANRWQNISADGKFLFSVKAMSKVFRAKFVAELAAKIKIDKALRERLFKKEWVVYAKKPFGGPKAVIEYLGRYTHKVAISNNRIKAVDDHTVTISYKDYKTGGTIKELTLNHAEFIRRFAQHILPKGYTRIRHYGLLSSSWKRGKLQALQAKLGQKQPNTESKTHLGRCPCCKKGRLITLESFDRRGPPEKYVQMVIKQSNSTKL